MKPFLSQTMQLIATGCLVCLLAMSNYAQEIRDIDQSPLDLAVFRPDGQSAQPVARIIYSRPKKSGRIIFGELVPYDNLWRTGANQSTELNTYRDLYFQGRRLPAGDYTLYTIPGKQHWTIIINSNLFTWGDLDYEESEDVMRFDVPASKSTEIREHFGIAFGGMDGDGNLLLAWDNSEVLIPFKYK